MTKYRFTFTATKRGTGRQRVSQSFEGSSQELARIGCVKALTEVGYRKLNLKYVTQYIGDIPGFPVK